MGQNRITFEAWSG